MNIANKRRQDGKVETHSDLDSGRVASEVEKVVIAVVGGEGDQKQERAGCEREPALAIKRAGW